MEHEKTTSGKAKGKLEQRSFILMLVGVSLLFVYLLKPFFGSIFWACIIGLLFHPLHLRFVKVSGNRPTLAAVAESRCRMPSAIVDFPVSPSGAAR